MAMPNECRNKEGAKATLTPVKLRQWLPVYYHRWVGTRKARQSMKL